VNAFVTGGLLPAPARGRKLSGLGAVWDWCVLYIHTSMQHSSSSCPPLSSPPPVPAFTNTGFTCRYGTFAHLAGVDPTDHRAAAAGLPPVDSLNLWPYVSGQVCGAQCTMLHVLVHTYEYKSSFAYLVGMYTHTRHPHIHIHSHFCLHRQIHIHFHFHLLPRSHSLSPSQSPPHIADPVITADRDCHRLVILQSCRFVLLLGSSMCPYYH
jgi:hypothetical protein